MNNQTSAEAAQYTADMARFRDKAASVTGSAPDGIWLQSDGDQEPDYFSEHEGVTWAPDQIYKHDVEYLCAKQIRDMAQDALNSFRIQGKPVPEEVRKLLTALSPNKTDQP